MCYHSPCGNLLLGTLGGKLCMCEWDVESRKLLTRKRLNRILGVTFESGDSDVANVAARQLDEYFGGVRTHFDVPLLPMGTGFQRNVWGKLLTIPYASTMSYGEMARQMGVPRAVRAVATADRTNAISIFIPCHRVIGNDGRLVGYGGGLDAKRFLLQLERDNAYMHLENK